MKNKEKVIKKISKDAKELRRDFREEYVRIAKEFNDLCERMDKFLEEMI